MKSHKFLVAQRYQESFDALLDHFCRNPLPRYQIEFVHGTTHSWERLTTNRIWKHDLNTPSTILMYMASDIHKVHSGMLPPPLNRKHRLNPLL